MTAAELMTCYACMYIHIETKAGGSVVGIDDRAGAWLITWRTLSTGKEIAAWPYNRTTTELCCPSLCCVYVFNTRVAHVYTAGNNRRALYFSRLNWIQRVAHASYQICNLYSRPSLSVSFSTCVRIALPRVIILDVRGSRAKLAA